MDEFLADVGRVWQTGGTGSTVAYAIAPGLFQAYRGAASVLCSDEQQPGRLQQWAFFVMSPDARHCKQLEGAPKNATWAPTLPGGKGTKQMVMQSQGAPDVLIDQQQYSFSKGAETARLIVHCAPKCFAAVPVLTTNLTVTLDGASGEPETEDRGTLHLCMWRRDVLEAVQAQLGLSDAAVVLCKVWPCLGRAGLCPVPGPNRTGALTGFNVAGLLVCWECGAMPAELHHCSRCSIACYCSQGCQRANYSSCHRRWCKGLAGKLAEQEVAACTSAAYKAYDEDLSAAVLRPPRATALCDVAPARLAAVQLVMAMRELGVGQGDAASPSIT